MAFENERKAAQFLSRDPDVKWGSRLRSLRGGAAQHQYKPLLVKELCPIPGFRSVATQTP